ncbi:50S ribosomal protein L20 [Candidatus Woesebacteria bacterium]|nr:50S ribosomal protein L20 [Candidatus Woesebacteria bacterium]MCD8507266.1 50S ribosomal protein L20 [Candidatus Woesebacteria bacterium]MCD8545993.1 50S ribosomal protein L20 [Candidatus Woesebacteria bacterium]
MSRVKTGPYRRRRHQKVLKANKGFRMTKNRLYKVSKEAFLHAGKYAYIGRKNRKRDFRRLWISRISAGLQNIADAVNYSRFVNQLKKADIQLNRKMLSEMAARDFESFSKVVEVASKAK